MPSIIYDVAVSIDGYIAGPDGDISKFAHQGAVVDDYTARLADYSAAIMGRATYEFGYRFGLEPGRNPYPHMKTRVFSRTIEMPDHGEVEIIRGDARVALDEIKSSGAGPIYLCGGGKFAASLLRGGMIDLLRLKRAPILLGGGTPIFDGAAFEGNAVCTETSTYDGGYLFQEFKLRG